MIFRLTLSVLSLAASLVPAALAGQSPPRIDASILGMPRGPWPFVLQDETGSKTFLIPDQLNGIRRLPAPLRNDALNAIHEHEGNLKFLRRTMDRFFPTVRRKSWSMALEHDRDLSEVLMEIDLLNPTGDPLHRHEPLLKALPSYTRVALLTPRSLVPQVAQRLEGLNLASRVHIVPIDQRGSEGITRWVRDLMLPVQAGSSQLVLTPLNYRRQRDISDNDLSYLDRLAGPGRKVLRVPLFFQGGNLAILSKGGKRQLLVGQQVMAQNADQYVKIFGFLPPREAIPAILRTATGVDEVEILPNSTHLYHLDMFLIPLGDGVVGLLSPEDPEHLEAADRDVLDRARQFLARAGFQTVNIPTTAQRIRTYQASTNILLYVDRETGRRRALVPQFPDPSDRYGTSGLGARILAAYRSAGIDPIPVEDRFHQQKGSLHCAALPLH